ncbi:MAG: Oligopeptide transport ATP-binding protein OppF, partial [uncultured Solirubrobacteraceae bacterium]
GGKRAGRGPGPQEALPDHQGHHPRQAGGRRPRGGRRVVRRPRGGDPRPRRRVGLRQVDHRAAHHAPARPDRGDHLLRRPGHRDDVAQGAQAAAARHADGLPGPLLVAQPAQDRRHDHLRALRHPRRGGRRAQAQAARPGAHGARRAQPGALQPPAARVLRRPAPAHRGGPGDRPQAEARGGRRAGLRPGRVHPGADPQPPAPAPARPRPDHRLHRARPLRRAAHVRPHRGDVPRQDRRARVRRRALRPPAPPLHGRAAVRRPGARPEAGQPQAAPGPQGGRAVPDEPAPRLPLPHPLPEVRGRQVRRRRAPARPEGGRQPRRLPLPADGSGARAPGADGRGL